MGMSTRVVGFRPPDDKWNKMRAIYIACVAADVEIPEQVMDFFNGEKPDPSGVEVNLDNILKGFKMDGAEGFELELAHVPFGVSAIRFFNSW